MLNRVKTCPPRSFPIQEKKNQTVMSCRNSPCTLYNSRWHPIPIVFTLLFRMVENKLVPDYRSCLSPTLNSCTRILVLLIGGNISPPPLLIYSFIPLSCTHVKYNRRRHHKRYKPKESKLSDCWCLTDLPPSITVPSFPEQHATSSDIHLTLSW